MTVAQGFNDKKLFGRQDIFEFKKIPYLLEISIT